MAPVRRIAQIVHLKPSAVAAYKECHANVWPEVLQQIKDCNITDCMTEEPSVSNVAINSILRPFRLHLFR